MYCPQVSVCGVPPYSDANGPFGNGFTGLGGYPSGSPTVKGGGTDIYSYIIWKNEFPFYFPAVSFRRN